MPFSNATRTQAFLTAVALAAGVLLAATIGRGIVRPLAGMTGTMKRLAAVDIPGRDGSDEIAEMARAVDAFRQGMISSAAMQAARTHGQAAKEARQAAIDNHVAGFDRSVRDLLGTLADSAAEMRTAAGSMAATAEQTDRRAAYRSPPGRPRPMSR